MSTGRDAAFIGPNENQFAILDDDKTGLAVYTLPGGASQETKDNDKLFEENQPTETEDGSIRGPTPFMFETEVDRIYSTPLGASIHTYLLGHCLFLLTFVVMGPIDTGVNKINLPQNKLLPTGCNSHKNIKDLLHSMSFQINGNIYRSL